MPADAGLTARDRAGEFRRVFRILFQGRRSSRANSGGRLLRRTKAPHRCRMIAFRDDWD